MEAGIDRDRYDHGDNAFDDEPFMGCVSQCAGKIKDTANRAFKSKDGNER